MSFELFWKFNSRFKSDLEWLEAVNKQSHESHEHSSISPHDLKIASM